MTPSRMARLLVAVVVLVQAALGAAGGQDAIDLERDVVPAVVQIAVRIVESGGGVAPAEQLVPRGSGTVIAPHGLVLTSAHVLDVRDLIASAEARQADYQQQGLDRRVRVIADEYVLLFPLLPDEPPIPLYTAAAEQVDADLLDLAVLRITGGPKNQPVSLPDLRFVPLGDSDDLGRTDRIFVVGYPGIADTGIIDSGEVNSFETAPGISGRAWIITDATVSGGSSGGAAVDAAGRLIGVITLASALDCRPGDTNDDGVVDALDIGCVPVGSALARLRPINLAAPLLTAAGLATPAAETATPTPTATPSPTEPPAPTATPVLPTPTPTLAPPPTSTPAPPTSTPVPPTPTPTPLPVIAEPPATIPMYRGNPARTGEVPGPGPLGDPVSLWTFTTANWVHASPVAADQIVYIGSRDGNIYALDAFSGAERWRFPTSSGTQSTAAVVDGVVYVGGSDDTIFALDAFTGAELWRVPTGSSIVSSPAMVDGVVYFGNWDGILYALDAGSGAERWRFDTNASGGGAQSSIEASPAVVDGVVYIGNYAGNVYAIDAVTGEELWRSTVGHFVKATAAVSAGVAYVIDFDGNFEGAIHALDAGTGEELWRVPVGNFAVAAPAVAGGTVYVGDPAGYIVALDAATGTERWRVGTDFGVQSSPTVADGVVYVGSGLVPTTGALHAIDVATGEALWQVPAASGVASSPAVVAGIVYFGSYDGNVYAVAGSEFP